MISTYEIHKDLSNASFLKSDAERYYIRTTSHTPNNYLTENMTYREVMKVAEAMRQLGFVVVDRSES
jgi:hypothetical protein